MDILVRYGEIALKSRPVRNRFESVLVANIRRALSSAGLKSQIRREFGRIFVSSDKKALPVMQRVFGIVSISPYQKCSSNLDEIVKLAVSIGSKFKGSFAVKTRRMGSHSYRSQEVNEKVGAAIAALGKSVNLSSPDNIIYIESRDKHAYIYTEKFPGPGGLPLGTQGKVAVLAEDEKGLIAAWLFMKRGADVVLVTKFDVKPLEKWSFKPIEKRESLEPLEEAGIVTAKISEMQSLKKHGKPVYNPLLGLGIKEIKELKRKVYD